MSPFVVFTRPIMTPLQNNLSLLPVYEPSAPSPSYTYEPTDDEQTLQNTPMLISPPPTGTYTKESEKVVVTLFEQEKDVEIPTYGRRALISGTVYLENVQRVFQIDLKIEGTLDSTSSGGGYQPTKLICICRTLWSHGEDSTCPNLIPFSCILPSSYEDGDFQHPLPPSYTYSYSGAYTLFVSSHYSVNVRVKRGPHHMVGRFLTMTQQIAIPFRYYPRTRPHRHILANTDFLSAVKALPEEWFQALSELKTRPNSQLEPISCHLFVPAARVYGLRDTIPFHVQLSGRLSSVKSFLMVPRSDNPALELDTSDGRSLQLSSHSGPIVRVYLLRHVSIETRGCKTSRNTIIAEGRLREIPPAHSHCESEDAMHLDWEGEVRCGHDICVGGFAASNVVVKDFIGIGINPPAREHEASQFLELQMSVPIRLVTDPYMEVTDYDRT